MMRRGLGAMCVEGGGSMYGGCIQVDEAVAEVNLAAQCCF
jgi:hypothetical protein